MLPHLLLSSVHSHICALVRLLSSLCFHLCAPSFLPRDVMFHVFLFTLFGVPCRCNVLFLFLFLGVGPPGISDLSIQTDLKVSSKGSDARSRSCIVTGGFIQFIQFHLSVIS